MELLLNLCWVSLALPAYWLWKREREAASRSHQTSRLGSIVVLGCMLMLLFPVVSATDDLHAMRPEIEESNPSKQIARQVDGGSSSAINIAGGLLALLMPVSIANVELRTIGVLSNGSVVVGTQTRLGPDSGRAPPSA